MESKVLELLPMASGCEGGQLMKSFNNLKLIKFSEKLVTKYQNTGMGTE
jgi:hypothetical protein